jgi:hypothetical protein
MTQPDNNFVIQLDKTQYVTPDISKKGSFIAANNLYTSIMEGHSSAIQVAEMLKFVEETTKQLKEITDDDGKNSFTDLVREEIVRNSDDGKSYTSKFGNKFELLEAGVKFDFSSCGDPIWNDLNQQLEKIKVELKERESFLKGLKSSVKMDIINPKTGEIHEQVELYPPIKSSTSTYKQTMING